MSRWSRATRAVRGGLTKGSRVLDVGAAWGFGTAVLARDYELHALDINPSDISHAPSALRSRLAASATALPYRDATFDGALCLDVLEHIPEAQQAVHEIARVLRPGGLLVLSVPNRGLFWWLDSNNVGARFFDPGEIVPPGWRHHHFSEAELSQLIDKSFVVEQVRYNGTGLAEPLHLPVLALTRGIPGLRHLYRPAAFAYYTGALADDLIPAGKWGYNLTLTARRL